MSGRAQMVFDAGNHLADEIRELTMRHLLVMRAGGMTAIEGVAAQLHALNVYSATSFGMAVAGGRQDKRAESLELLIIEHAAELRTEIPRIVKRLDALDERRASR